MTSKILTVLLIFSVLLNIYLIEVYPSSKDLLELKDKINQLENEKAGLKKQIYQDNISMMNISLEIKPGKGRILVETKPLMGVVFQDAANTAVYVAQKKTGKDLSGSDVIFSIEATHEVPSVDGPSADALMTLLVIAGIENLELQEDITMTGTIDKDGHVGEIGGVIEKAKAAKKTGKNLILIPEENSILIQYVGINVEYIDSLDDMLKYAE